MRYFCFYFLKYFPTTGRLPSGKSRLMMTIKKRRRKSVLIVSESHSGMLPLTIVITVKAIIASHV